MKTFLLQMQLLCPQSVDLSCCSRLLSFSGSPASAYCDGTHVSPIRGHNLLLLAFKMTPGDNWALKWDPPGGAIPPRCHVDQLMPAMSIEQL